VGGVAGAAFTEAELGDVPIVAVPVAVSTGPAAGMVDVSRRAPRRGNDGSRRPRRVPAGSVTAPEPPAALPGSFSAALSLTLWAALASCC
jgi:hypothetical protein